MSLTLSIKGFTGKNNSEFKKHQSAVVFCLTNDLSFPKETSEFFKGKIDGGDLEDFNKEYVFEKIQNGIEVDLNIDNIHEYRKIINVSDIPKHCEQIIIEVI